MNCLRYVARDLLKTSDETGLSKFSPNSSHSFYEYLLICYSDDLNLSPEEASDLKRVTNTC